MTTAGILFCATMAVLLAACLLRAVFEPTQLEVTRTCFYQGKDGDLYGCQKEDPLDAARQGQPDLRILFLSDLHYNRLRVKTERLTVVKEIKPDLLLFGGDLTECDKDLPLAVEWLTKIREQCGNPPLVAVPGNHDSDRALSALKKAGAIVLQNDCYFFSCRGLSFLIMGLEDKKRTGKDQEPALPFPAMHRDKINCVSPERRLILVHNPDALLHFPHGQASLFCAGHFHGGQIWMPFKLEFRLFRHEILPFIAPYKGCVRWGDLVGYITRGLGCVVVPLRFRSKPELSVLDIFLHDQKDGPSS